MDSKDRLAEMIAGMTEAQAAPLANIAQAYLAAMREAEEKGRTDVSSEVIQYLGKVAPATAPREPAAPRPAWNGAYQQQIAPAQQAPVQPQAYAPPQNTPALK